MTTFDLGILFFYLAAVAVVGFWVGRRQDKDSYFLNRRRSGFFLVLFSIVSTNVGAATCLGIAAAAYSTGISYGINIAILVTFGFILLGSIAPRIKQLADSHGLTTMSSVFRVCYGSTRRQVLAPLDQLPLAQPQQERLEGGVLSPADGRGGCVVPQHRRQLELLEVMFQQDRRLPLSHGRPPAGTRRP